jgi:ketosteroid isomerase-like protein
MSHENVELVRSIYAAVERGDYSAADWASPDIEYVVADGPEPVSLTGRDGLAAAMRSAFSVMEDWRDAPEDYRELDDRRVLVLSRFTSIGKASRLEVEQRVAQLFEIERANVMRIVVYFDRDQAPADLGLAE